jgi:hypothetical protein
MALFPGGNADAAESLRDGTGYGGNVGGASYTTHAVDGPAVRTELYQQPERPGRRTESTKSRSYPLYYQGFFTPQLPTEFQRMVYASVGQTLPIQSPSPWPSSSERDVDFSPTVHWQNAAATLVNNQ